MPRIRQTPALAMQNGYTDWKRQTPVVKDGYS
jgi:hypothetical protein